MATRAVPARVSQEHVRALNMIDLEFIGEKFLGYFSKKSPNDKYVREAWNTYRDHFNTPYDRNKEDAVTRWIEKGDDLFLDLLHKMSKSVGYDFDLVELKRGCYSPEAHGTLVLYQQALLRNLHDVFAGKKSIPIKIVNDDPTSEQDQATYVKSLPTVNTENKHDK